MKTRIYKTYGDFLARKNKEENGVSPEFAKSHPQYESENETNRGCWNCSYCFDCSRCEDCVRCADCEGCVRCEDSEDCEGCVRCEDCENCVRCEDCENCVRCEDCQDCVRCSDCSDCSDCSEKKGEFTVPKIKNIHESVYKAASQKDALNMKDWHTCETTHCRAGWVVTLAGEEGKLLEAKTTTIFAAMQIYKASSPIRVSPVRFFDSNEATLSDMKRCAVEEKNTMEGR